jgi:hypothetical protein
MGFKQVIKTHIQPSIKLIELSDYDNSVDGEGAISKKDKNYADFSQVAGTQTPFVKMGGQIVNNIESLIIDESGFIPKLTLIFVDGNGEFAGNYFPKRNLIVSVFINSSNDKFKPIRSDYLITEIKTISPKNRMGGLLVGKKTTYIIKAELFVPRLYNNVSKSYKQMTSTDTLKKVCEELGLGYAQNEFATSDSMTWINFNTSPSNFIKQVLNYSFKDENSFFHGFISKELMLVMLEVNTQLIGGDSDFTFSNSTDSELTSLYQSQKNDVIKTGMNESEIVNLLTSQRQSSGKPNYIYEANLISGQGSILKNEGYKKQIHYYDHTETESNKFKKFFIVPTNSDGATEASMLIPDDEGLDEVGNKKWMNVNYGNTHPRWNAARVINSHNLNELEKIKLRVLLKGINFQVIRGMDIPVVITQSMAEKITKETGQNNEDGPNPENLPQDSEALDNQLSGWYYVKEAKYVYDKDDEHKFHTELILARREWAPNKIKFTANA